MVEKLATHLAPFTDLISSRFDPEREEIKQDITAFYNVENDIFFLQKYANSLTPQERNHYVKKNILGLLSEFAGKIPYRKITYLLGDKGLCYGDIKIIEMLQYTSDLTGQKSREAQENIGHSWVYQVFEDSYRGGKNLKPAAIISPPKNWDYGYLFYYATEFDPELNRDVVKMHAIRYDESRYEIKNSQNILFCINPQLFYKTTREFLEFPIFNLVKTPDLDSILSAVGVSKQDVEYSHWFENAVMSDEIISYGVSRYIQLATNLVNDSNHFDQENRPRKLLEMEFLLRGMYNRATKLKEAYDQLAAAQNIPSHVDYISKNDEQDVHPTMLLKAFAGYADKPAVVVGGGSCPSMSNKESRGFMSSYQLSESLLNGITIESVISKNLTNDAENSDEFGPLEFVCPHSDCKKINRRPPHKLIPMCQYCGKDVKCA